MFPSKKNPVTQDSVREENESVRGENSKNLIKKLFLCLSLSFGQDIDVLDLSATKTLRNSLYVNII